MTVKGLETVHRISGDVTFRVVSFVSLLPTSRNQIYVVTRLCPPLWHYTCILVCELDDKEGDEVAGLGVGVAVTDGTSFN